MAFKTQVQTIVGGIYRYALFYNFPGGLRFELSAGDSPLDQALSALRKATAVCEDVFAGEDCMLVHLSTHAPASRFGLRKMLFELKAAGIVVPGEREVWFDVEEPEDDGDNLHLHCAFEVPVAKLQNLLWCAITLDLWPLSPRPCCKVYLLNRSKGIVAHAYDDRGMDVIARDAAVLTGLYQQHHALLFDYDIDAMRLTFEPLTT